MKKINVYSLHPAVFNLESFIKHYNFSQLQNDFEFVWNKDNPEYLFAGEHIYWNRAIFKTLRRYWMDGRSKGCIFIQYLEEAEKPDLNIFDYAICYDDSLTLGDRITRICPANIFFSNFIIESAHPPGTIIEAKKILDEKSKFCNFMYSHPFPERDDLYKLISSYKKVDALGRRFHNTDIRPTPYNGYEKQTTTLRYPYKFTIASENGQYRGYTSEKIITAFQANTIPIYWGNPNISLEFNKKSFINVNDYTSERDILEHIKYIDENDDVWCKMACEPWQTDTQKKQQNERQEQYICFFRDMFKKTVKDTKRLEYSMHMTKYQIWFWNNVPSGNYLRQLLEKKKLYFMK